MTLIKAAGVEVEPYWPSLFAKLLANTSVDDLIMNVGSGAPAAAPAAGGAPAAGDGASHGAAAPRGAPPPPPPPPPAASNRPCSTT